MCPTLVVYWNQLYTALSNPYSIRLSASICPFNLPFFFSFSFCPCCMCPQLRIALINPWSIRFSAIILSIHFAFCQVGGGARDREGRVAKSHFGAQRCDPRYVRAISTGCLRLFLTLAPLAAPLVGGSILPSYPVRRYPVRWMDRAGLNIPAISRPPISRPPGIRNLIFFQTCAVLWSGCFRFSLSVYSFTYCVNSAARVDDPGEAFAP